MQKNMFKSRLQRQASCITMWSEKEKGGLFMELLEKRILSEGKVKPGNILKVDSFLNHQLDPALFYEMAQELKRLY